MNSNRYYIAAAWLTAALLTACGGGDGETPNPVTPPPIDPTGTYLFYSGSLNAVDPASPTTPITVEAGNDISPTSSIYHADYDSASRTATNQHSHALVYAKTDGKLYRVSALKNESLTPIQVSNESNADQLCGSFARSDFFNPANAQYLYLQSGPDNDCSTINDNIWRMVRLGMSATDTPIPAKLPITSLIDSTGALSGWLAYEAGSLIQCDANFANCTPPFVSASHTAYVMLEIDGSNNRFLMNIDNQLFIYDANSNTLSAPLFTIPAGTFLGTPLTTDGDYIYFGHGNFIYRFPADGSTVATSIRTETSTIFDVDVTTNRVIFMVGPQVKSIPKDGNGIATTLASTSAQNGLLYYLSGDFIYYSILNFTTSPSPSLTSILAGIVDEHGGNQATFSNSHWVGALSPISYDFNQGSNTLDDPAVMVLGQASSGNFSDVTLKSIDAKTATESVALGTLPSSIRLDNYFFCSGSIDNSLCLTLVDISPTPPPSGAPVQFDVFFVNTAIANSLRRVTDTQDKNEIPLFN